MRLLTLAGAYAGQIRDYSYPAAIAALKSGTAARLVQPVAASVHVTDGAKRSLVAGPSSAKFTKRK